MPDLHDGGEPDAGPVKEPNNPALVLAKAEALIFKGWSKGTSARNAEGERCHPLDPEAASWDILGAVARCLPQGGGHEEVLLATWAAVEKAKKQNGIEDLTTWNDKLASHADVLLLIRSAIRYAEQEAT